MPSSLHTPLAYALDSCLSAIVEDSPLLSRVVSNPSYNYGLRKCSLETRRILFEGSTSLLHRPISLESRPIKIRILISLVSRLPAYRKMRPGIEARVAQVFTSGEAASL